MSDPASWLADARRRALRRFAHAGLAAFVLGAAISPGAHASSPPASAEQKTLELAARVTALKRAGRDVTSSRARDVEQIVVLAAARRQLLRGLIQEDPAEFLRLALPDRVRDSMPAAARRHVEQYRDISGVLQVRYEDRGHRSRLVYELDTGSQLIELHFAKAPPRLQSGTRVRGGGLLLDKSMVFSSGTALVTLNLDDDGSSWTATAGATVPPLSNTIGEQRTLVLLVNWLDNPGEQPYSLQQAHDLVFGTVSSFMRENSFGRAWLTGEVHGWFTLPFARPTDPNTTCKQTVVAQAAQQAALEAGIDLSAFNRYIYVFPQTSCFPSGTGTVGGTPSQAWINGYWFKLKTVAHEFGHNLGLFHAGAQECGATIFGSACDIYPYGDTMDVMGNNAAGHFSAYNKERLGWIGEAAGTIATAFDGTHTLEAYESAPQQAPKALKIFKDLNPETGEPTWYYLEFRQALGFDGFLAGNANVANGVVVRVATETATPSSVSSLLLDMTPESSTIDWDDPALAFGSAFNDPLNGVTLTTQAGTAGTVIVNVGVSQASCSTSAPLLSVSPAEGRWSAPGTPAAYVVKVTNVDGAACDAAAFALDPSIPTGWAVSLEKPSLTLSPGTSGEIGVTVTSPAAAADGVYTFDVAAVRINAAGAGASATLTYVVSAALTNHAPVPRDDSAETSPRTPVVIAVLLNDTDPENDPLAVTAASQGAQGTVQVKADGTIVYTPKGKASGEDTFSYTVSDGMAQSTARVRILNVANGAGGGTGKGKGKP